MLAVSRLRISSALPVCSTRPWKASALRWVSSVSETTVGRAASPAATTPTMLASRRPVPMRSVSTSSCALGGAPGSRRPPRPCTPGEPRPKHSDQDQVAERREQDRRDQVHAGTDRRQQVEDEAVDQRDRDEGRHRGPRKRQRIRAGQKRSSRFTDRRVAFRPCLSSGPRSSDRCPTRRVSPSRTSRRCRAGRPSLTHPGSPSTRLPALRALELTRPADGR